MSDTPHPSREARRTAARGPPRRGYSPTAPTEPIAAGPPPRRLTRSSSDRVIGGVAGGLGRYFDIDPIIFRIGFVILALAGGAGVLGYIAAWVLVPADPVAGQEPWTAAAPPRSSAPSCWGALHSRCWVQACSSSLRR